MFVAIPDAGANYPTDLTVHRDHLQGTNPLAPAGWPGLFTTPSCTAYTG